MERWIGKLAVVTGVSSGIGKATAEALVKQGIIVAGLARRLERMEKHAQELKGEKGKLHPFRCDLTNQEELLSTFKKITETLGPIFIMINNAGLSLKTEVINGDVEKWKIIIDTNLVAMMICSREAMNSMIANNIKGQIIQINSYLGQTICDVPHNSVYPATKYGVTGFTENLRFDLNREKIPIKITSISPGVVKTEIFKVATDGAIEEYGINRAALESKDISDTVIYVLSTPEHVNVKELTVVVQGEEF